MASSAGKLEGRRGGVTQCLGGGEREPGSRENMFEICGHELGTNSGHWLRGLSSVTFRNLGGGPDEANGCI